MALFNKILGKEEREPNLKQEIRSLEFRKESVVASINKEIAHLQSEQNALFVEAGKYAYDVWREDETKADLSNYWNRVEKIAEKIAGQEAKRQEMTERYDEEINLMASNFDVNVTVNSGSSTMATGFGSCPNCGSAIDDGDVFCQNCGTKLQ